MTQQEVTGIDLITIARIAHEANREWCESHGDFTQTSWAEAPEWQRVSCLRGVELHFRDPTTTPSQSHDAWRALKDKEGWVYGTVKDIEKKRHPCMVAYEELPEKNQIKDHLFKAIVNALSPFVQPGV